MIQFSYLYDFDTETGPPGIVHCEARDDIKCAIYEAKAWLVLTNTERSATTMFTEMRFNHAGRNMRVREDSSDQALLARFDKANFGEQVGP